MGTYKIKELVKKWSNAELPLEMATGHIIQHVQLLWAEVKGLGQKLSQVAKAQREAKKERQYMQAEIDRLLKHNKLKPLDRTEPPKRKRGRPRKNKDWWEDADAG